MTTCTIPPGPVPQSEMPAIGAPVGHAVFGNGTVIDHETCTSGPVIVVDFGEAGVKKLLLRFASLSQFGDTGLRFNAQELQEFDKEVAAKLSELRVRKAAQDLLKAEDEPPPTIPLVEILLDGDQLDSLPTPEPLIDGVLSRHCYMILRGRDSTYKSFAALDWALCLATGKPWQGHASERVRVLYIAGEGAYGLAARKKAWEYAWRQEVDPGMFTVLPRGLDLHSAAELSELLAIVAEGRYTLVIIDTLRRVSGRADGNTSEMGVVVDNIDKVKWATLDGSVLVLAHTDKGDNDTRGYSGIEDDGDIIWHAKLDDGRIRLKNAKMKDEPGGAEFVLKPVAYLDSIILSAVVDTPGSEDTTASQRAIIYALANTFMDTFGASSSELIEVTSLPRSTFYLARGALLRTGQIVSNGPVSRARYSLAGSNSVQRDDKPLSRDIPTSPTPVQPTSPVQSSPPPLVEVDVGLDALDKEEEAP